MHAWTSVRSMRDKGGNTFQRQKETALPAVQDMFNVAHNNDAPNQAAPDGNGAQDAPGAPPPEEASPFDVPAVDGERGSEGARGAKVTLRSSVTEYFTAVVIGATPRMTMTTEVAISAVNSHVCNVGGMVAPSSPRVPMQTKSMANRSGSRRSRPWLPPAPDATMSRQPRARETSGLLATSRDVRDVQERQERLMERQERGQERLMEVMKRQTAVTRELNAKAIELIGAQREAHRLQMIASVEASRKVNELKSALSHFMNATDRTLRSLDSPREGGISRIHFAAAERCLGAEWSAIEALMRDIPACAVFAPCFSKLAHLQLAAPHECCFCSTPAGGRRKQSRPRQAGLSHRLSWRTPPPPPTHHTTTVSLCAMQTTSTPDCTQKQHEAAHIRRREWRRENPGTAWTSS